MTAVNRTSERAGVTDGDSDAVQSSGKERQRVNLNVIYIPKAKNKVSCSKLLQKGEKREKRAAGCHWRDKHEQLTHWFCALTGLKAI